MIRAIAITGTPGTGKSTIAELIASKGGFVPIEVSELVDGIRERYDPVQDTFEIDIDSIRAALEVLLDDYRSHDRVPIVVGHLSHLLGPDLTVVLRCDPGVLRERLVARSYSAAKVQENVEAEAIGTIIAEAMGTKAEVFEIETHEDDPDLTAQTVIGIVRGEGDLRERYSPRRIDYLESLAREL